MRIVTNPGNRDCSVDRTSQCTSAGEQSRAIVTIYDRLHQRINALEHALSLGGTITGEHGVGLAKKKFLRQQLGNDSYALLKTIKHALDPHGLLNPGKILD